MKQNNTQLKCGFEMISNYIEIIENKMRGKNKLQWKWISDTNSIANGLSNTQMTSKVM